MVVPFTLDIYDHAQIDFICLSDSNDFCFKVKRGLHNFNKSKHENTP